MVKNDLNMSDYQVHSIFYTNFTLENNKKQFCNIHKYKSLSGREKYPILNIYFIITQKQFI